MNAALPLDPAQDAIRAWRDAVERALLDLVHEIPGDDEVAASLRYALGSGGKRLRPVLCLAAADAVTAGGATPARLPALARAAAAIEVVHTYSLMHDDLPCMDDDDLRRGRPTPHRVFGTAAAAAAGFAAIPYACQLLDSAAAELGMAAASRAAVVRELCRGAGAAGMVGGQVIDLEAEGTVADLAALRRMHAMKTGALFAAALRIGGHLGGAPAPTIAALGRFGEHLGLAFQIADDVLDETTDAGTLGKTPGKDRADNKATFTSLLGVAAARAAAHDEAAAARAVLRAAGIASAPLDTVAGFAASRDR
jgi:farnesyl diphosphate synthase